MEQHIREGMALIESIDPERAKALKSMPLPLQYITISQVLAAHEANNPPAQEGETK